MRINALIYMYFSKIVNRMAIFVEKACGARQGRNCVHAASATSAPVPDEACRFRQDPARLALRQITFRVFGKQPCRPPGTPRLAEDGARKPATIGSRSWLWRRAGSGGRGSTRPARSLTGVGGSALPRVETGKGGLAPQDARAGRRGGLRSGGIRATLGVPAHFDVFLPRDPVRRGWRAVACLCAGAAGAAGRLCAVAATGAAWTCASV